MTEEQKQRRARLLAAGVCVHCARRPSGGYKRCIVCRGLLAAAQRQKYERAKREHQRETTAGRIDKLMCVAEIVERKGRQRSKYAA